MKKFLTREKIQYNAPVVVCILLIVFLFFLPTGYQEIYREAEQCVAQVLQTDESKIVDTGLVRSGEQRCILAILNGRFKGQTVEGINMLNGSLEQDKIFAVGDRAQVVVSHDGDEILMTTMIDHDRMPSEFILLALFGIFLILFAGRTGVRALLCFVLTILAIWKLLVPFFLGGNNPIWVGIIFTLVLSVMTIALVYGFDRRCASATSTSIFMASIFIGASGALIDLSVDITSAVYEVVQKRPDISWKEATASGMNVGRAAMGTMTTTLLLAYSGGYIAMLMVFMAQGTPLVNMINYKYVAAEIVHTIVGSIGLVAVAPFTALCAGVLLTRVHRQPQQVEQASANEQSGEEVCAK